MKGGEARSGGNYNRDGNKEKISADKKKGNGAGGETGEAEIKHTHTALSKRGGWRPSLCNAPRYQRQHCALARGQRKQLPN